MKVVSFKHYACFIKYCSFSDLPFTELGYHCKLCKHPYNILTLEKARDTFQNSFSFLFLQTILYAPRNSKRGVPETLEPSLAPPLTFEHKNSHFLFTVHQRSLETNDAQVPFF